MCRLKQKPKRTALFAWVMMCVYDKISFFGRFSRVCWTISIFLLFLVFRLPVSTHGTTQELTSYKNLLVTKILDFLDGWQCYLVDI